eukprot:COSAG06_NODE_56447_length_284_cov_1.643243_1_plen_56_part_01
MVASGSCDLQPLDRQQAAGLTPAHGGGYLGARAVLSAKGAGASPVRPLEPKKYCKL